jgi:hypothetical protein
MRAAKILVLMLAGSVPAFAGAAYQPGTSVEMPYLIAPVVVDGVLTSNAYVSSKIIATSPAATIVVRDKLAFIQDAFVRDVNGAPIGKPGDPATVDAPALAARLLADARHVVGPNLVDTVEIIRIQISPLRGGGPS